MKMKPTTAVFQRKLPHLWPGPAAVSRPEPEPAPLPARQSLQEHGPGYDSEPAAHWWGDLFC